MQYILSDLTPNLPYRFFEEISAIPRPSGSEGAVARYIEHFAAEKGLFCLRDADDNVYVRKPAGVGREKEPPVLLQAHLDMVAESNAGVTHDFLTQGISLVREGNILRADGTTLGGDDGFGVAILLAVLADDTLSHPMVECLFTTSEETGLTGATNFDYKTITARRMINLDSDCEGEIIVGCCGGMRTDLTMPVSFSPVCGTAYRLFVHGLCGGHSGGDIDRGRLNSHKVMGALLSELQSLTPIRLVQLSGGDKDNAIPRECEAVVVPADAAVAERFFAECAKKVKAMIVAQEDADACVDIEKTSATVAMSAADTANALRVLSVRNAVLYHRTTPPIMPETSRNLARIRTEEGALSFGFSSRSSVPSRIEECREELDALAAAVSGSTRHYARYPGWESPADSALVRAWQKAYHEITGKETVATVIHAGLECGIMSAAMEGLTAISVGCNIRDLHTPAERMELDSFGRIYRTVLAFLAQC